MVVFSAAVKPAASSKFTSTVNFPVCVGVQENVAAFFEVQPLGRPLYEYWNGLNPNDSWTENVVEVSTNKVEGEAPKDVSVGSALTLNLSVPLFRELLTNVTVTLTGKVPAADGVQVNLVLL